MPKDTFLAVSLWILMMADDFEFLRSNWFIAGCAIPLFGRAPYTRIFVQGRSGQTVSFIAFISSWKQSTFDVVPVRVSLILSCATRSGAQYFSTRDIFYGHSTQDSEMFLLWLRCTTWVLLIQNVPFRECVNAQEVRDKYLTRTSLWPSIHQKMFVLLKTLHRKSGLPHR